MYGVYSMIRTLLTGIPALLFFSMLVIPRMPDATGMFIEGPVPGYCVITAPLFQIALAYSTPVTSLCYSLFGEDSFLSPGYCVVLALYTLILTILLHKVLVFFMGPIDEVKKP